jgi:hypothetical protein
MNETMAHRSTRWLCLFVIAALLAGLAMGLSPVPVAHAETFDIADGDVTALINAINTANGNSEADTINLAAGGTYTLTAVHNDTNGPNGLPSITSEITINGNGATIQRSSAGGTPDFRIFHVAAGGDLTLNDVTIRNGKTANGADGSDGGAGEGGSAGVDGGYGGGIYNSGSLTLNHSTVSNNTTGIGGAGGAGGDCTGDGCTAGAGGDGGYGGYGGYGGGIYNDDGTVVLTNSTVSGNTASAGGVGGTCTGTSCSAGTDGVDGAGGGIYNDETTNFKNTILAGNSAAGSGADCSGTFTSQGYNLVGDGTGCPSDGTGDQPTTDPKLGLLDLNGGPVGAGGGPKTHALLDGSPALDRIPGDGTNGCGTTCTTDERGKTRPVEVLGGGAKSDVGAFERQADEKTGENSAWTLGTQHDFGTDVNVKMTLQSGATSCRLTILKRRAWPGGSQDAGEFQILWTLTAGCSSYSFDVTLCYTEAELTESGVTDENAITAYRWDESSNAWITQTTTRDPGNNCVTVSGVTAISPWTIIGGGPPTTITLREFRAQTVDGLVYAGVVLAFLLFLGGGLALVRRRRG